MWRRGIFITIIVLILIIIGGAVYLYFQNQLAGQTLVVNNDQVINNNQDTNTPLDATNADNNQNSNNDQTPNNSPADKLSAETTARIFVEKYGTYSSDYPYENLKSVLDLVSDNLVLTYQKIISDGLAKINNEVPFYIVTSKVISANRVKDDDNGVVMEVLTQRTENYSRSSAPIVSYKKIDVTLKTVSDIWKVVAANWVTE